MMFYVYVGFFLVFCAFTGGIALISIDINRYSFGLYLILMSILVFSLLAAVCVIKPKICQESPSCFTRCFSRMIQLIRNQKWRRSQKQEDYLNITENIGMSPIPNGYTSVPIIYGMHAIPNLIQAIQFGMETYARSLVAAERAAASRTNSTVSTKVPSSAGEHDESSPDSGPFGHDNVFSLNGLLAPPPAAPRCNSVWTSETETNTWMSSGVNLKLMCSHAIAPSFPLTETSGPPRDMLRYRRRSSSADDALVGENGRLLSNILLERLKQEEVRAQLSPRRPSVELRYIDACGIGMRRSSYSTPPPKGFFKTLQSRNL